MDFREKNRSIYDTITLPRKINNKLKNIRLRLKNLPGKFISSDTLSLFLSLNPGNCSFK